MQKLDKVIAFYLPQFHPIAENNEWWGKGFTEWTNVSVSRPRFDGHRQPHIPADLGFYDLRLSETRSAQAELAKQYGIGGFCYYHYWFNGQMLLDRPLKEVIAEQKPDFPFCMCWANENWTRAWDGLDRQVLIKQDYTDDDSLSHFETLVPYFKDARYIKIDGKPLFLIYRMDHIPDPKSYFEKWRALAIQAGFPDLYLCAVKNGFVEMAEPDILACGFDAVLDFQPNRRDFPAADSTNQILISLARKILPDSVYQWLKLRASAVNRINYSKMVDKVISQVWPRNYVKMPCVFPSWDNSPRRKTPTVIQNDAPEKYTEWLKYAIDCVTTYPAGQRLVFINAWNEWAEGCHLEPDREMGHRFLVATKKAIDTSSSQS